MGIINYLKTIWQPGPKPAQTEHTAAVIPRAQHNISRKMLHKGALKILYTLHDAGFSAYLVGGGVRDLLLGRQPKDFDIATDAHPEQIKKLFRTCYLVGRRFRIAHVRIGQDIFEVSTFRSNQDSTDKDTKRSAEGLILRDNSYGTLAQDVWRRDFTVNALYYNIADFSVVDYTNGMHDLEQHVLRMIGDPTDRYREDPVRMLRALRLAAKLDFTLEAQTKAPITALCSLLLDVSPARLYLEVEKLFLSGHALQGYDLLQTYGMFAFLFPQVAECCEQQPKHTIAFLRHMLTDTDARLANDKYVATAFLLASLLWYPLQQQLQTLQQQHTKYEALQLAGDTILAIQNKRLAIPKRISIQMREIWYLQIQLQHRVGKRPLNVLQHPRFRAAYDFLLLRSKVDTSLTALVAWWDNFQQQSPQQRVKLLHALRKESPRSGTRKTTPPATTP